MVLLVTPMSLYELSSNLDESPLKFDLNSPTKESDLNSMSHVLYFLPENANDTFFKTALIFFVDLNLHKVIFRVPSNEQF